MDDTTRLALIRETMATFWHHSKDDDGDKNLADHELCLEFLDNIADTDDGPDLAGLIRDGWVTAEKAAEITATAELRAHVDAVIVGITPGQWRIETLTTGDGDDTRTRGRLNCVPCSWYAYEIAAGHDTTAGPEWAGVDLAELLTAAAAHTCPALVTAAYEKAHPDGH